LFETEVLGGDPDDLSVLRVKKGGEDLITLHDNGTREISDSITLAEAYKILETAKKFLEKRPWRS